MAGIVYSIRSFAPGEVEAYKRIRLEALLTEPRMFGSSHAREATFTHEQWLERITNPAAACLGLYRNDELIGITGIVIDRDKPGSAQLVQSYIRMPYRGLGLANMFYKARLEWAKEQGLKRIYVGHRAGNVAATSASIKYGFTYTHSEPSAWPDGSTGDIHYYELLL